MVGRDLISNPRRLWILVDEVWVPACIIRADTFGSDLGQIPGHLLPPRIRREYYLPQNPNN
jgi:hypothetical protein